MKMLMTGAALTALILTCAVATPPQDTRPGTPSPRSGSHLISLEMWDPTNLRQANWGSKSPLAAWGTPQEQTPVLVLHRCCFEQIGISVTH